MEILYNLARSLLLTGIFSFLAPVLVVIGLLVTGIAIQLIPGCGSFSHEGVNLVSQFLAVFGSGDAVKGVVVIGTVCSMVGILFDSYTFYRYQKMS